MKKEKKKQLKEKKLEIDSNGLIIGMCIGISIGTSIGASTNNMGLWLPFGLIIGTCIGLGISSTKNRK